MSRPTKKVFKKVAISVFVLVLLLSSLAGCKKAQPKEEGLPVLTIDGVRYPVTVEDGIKGLQNAHDGVIVRRIDQRYDPVFDANVWVYLNDLYKNDGTVITDYQGERKFSLLIRFPVERDLGIEELDIETSFIPIQVPNSLSAEDFGALMEENGFLQCSGASSDSFSKIYTDNGPIDMLDEDFITSMYELYRKSNGLSPAQYDDAYIEKELNSNPALLSMYRGSQAYDIFLQELKEGKATVYCQLRVTYGSDGTPYCEVILRAKSDLISSWLSKWYPGELPVEQAY